MQGNCDKYKREISKQLSSFVQLIRAKIYRNENEKVKIKNELEYTKVLSGIAEFQKLFDVIDVDFKEREAEWRIFVKVQDAPEKYPEKTSLQRAA